jgi:hypothetical protein
MMGLPKRLVVEYDDGSTKQVRFDKLDEQTHIALSKLGLCTPPGGVSLSEHYVLMRWDDGWQEVVGVDRDFVELLRYYVIERIEDRGRLSFDVQADYPELFIIRRMPRKLSSLLIISNDAVKTYNLTSSIEGWEGTFETGGKREYVKFDKTNSRYPQEVSEVSEALEEIIVSIKNELDRRGISPKELLENNQSRRIEGYIQIASQIGIRGKERREDVYGFMELIVKKLVSRGMEKPEEV